MAASTCVVCGRHMPHVKRARAGEGPRKYCSDACRARRLDATDAALEAAILDLLAKRGRDKTICPSEAARSVLGAAGLEAEAMQRTRRAARRLVAKDRIDIVQKGHVVDPSTARGPIRLRLR